MPSESTLRDELAIERTVLANERTLLAYLRTGLALVIAGVTMHHFATNEGWFWRVGMASIPLGCLAIAIGIYRFGRVNATITRARQLLNVPLTDP